MSQASESCGKSLRPVFIGGMMKSGTTLLRALLGQHPQLFATFETHWFDESVRLRWAESESKRMGLIQSLLELDEGELARLYETKRSEPQREFIDIVLAYCCDRAGKSRWVEKTPGNIRHWRLIREIWPDATLIHVTREYKDVYASWKTRRGDTLDTFLDAAKKTYDDVRPLLGRSADGYREIDYLDLVLNTEQTMRSVLADLGLPWDPACAVLDVDEGQRERRLFKDLMGRESWTLVSLSKPIFTDSIGQWRNLISEEESRQIEAELGEYYEIFGQRWANQNLSEAL